MLYGTLVSNHSFRALFLSVQYVGGRQITYRMLLLLNLKLRAILERPLDDIRLGGLSLDTLALLELRPPLREVRQLKQVPHVAGVGLDDGRFADRG